MKRSDFFTGLACGVVFMIALAMAHADVPTACPSPSHTLEELFNLPPNGMTYTRHPRAIWQKMGPPWPPRTLSYRPLPRRGARELDVDSLFSQSPVTTTTIPDQMSVLPERRKP